MKQLVATLAKLTEALTDLVRSRDYSGLERQLVWSERHTRRLEKLAQALAHLDAQTPDSPPQPQSPIPSKT